jgi:hypothetical protein
VCIFPGHHMRKRIGGFFGGSNEDDDPEAAVKRARGVAEAAKAFEAVITEKYNSCSLYKDAHETLSTQEVFDRCQAYYPSPFYFKNDIVDLLTGGEHKTYTTGTLLVWLFVKK